MANEYNIISDEALDVLCGAIKGIANGGEILDDTGVATNKTYSSFKIQEELDKKIEGDNVVKKDDIVTVLDDTVTDEQVASAKVVYENHIHSGSIPPCENIDDTTLDNGLYYITPETTGVLPRTNMYGMIRVECLNTHGNIWYHQTLVDVSVEISHAGNSPVWIRTNKTNTNTWNGWKRLCYTTVADVGVKEITWDDTTNYEPLDTKCSYMVKNGVCYVNIDLGVNSPNTSGFHIYNTGLPTPAFSYVHSNITHYSTSNISATPLTIAITDGELIIYNGSAGVRYLQTFSYPIAE